MKPSHLLGSLVQRFLVLADEGSIVVRDKFFQGHNKRDYHSNWGVCRLDYFGQEGGGGLEVEVNRPGEEVNLVLSPRKVVTLCFSYW